MKSRRHDTVQHHTRSWPEIPWAIGMLLLEVADSRVPPAVEHMRGGRRSSASVALGENIAYPLTKLVLSPRMETGHVCSAGMPAVDSCYRVASRRE